MKKYFVASLIKNGIIGGGIVADTEAVTYHTGKITIPHEYRHIVMKYADICKVAKGWMFVLPTVTVEMRNGKDYTFAVFFGRKRFVDTLVSMGVDG